jgi:hypothetical protein
MVPSATPGTSSIWTMPGWSQACSRSIPCPSPARPSTRHCANNFSQYKAGYLPLSIVDGWQQLVKDFAYWRASAVASKNALDPADRAWFEVDRARRERLVIRDLGVRSHYVGDASQPLHVSEHFDGWGPFPNPRGFSTAKGLHANFEGAFVRSNVERDAIKRAVAPYRACTCSVQDRARALIRESHGIVAL